MIFVPSSSLDVCATTANRTKSVPLTVCKMHALQCMRKNYMLAADSTCNWPVRSTTGCTNCHMWETCDGKDNLRPQTVHHCAQQLQLAVISFVPSTFFQIKPTSVAAGTLQTARAQE